MGFRMRARWALQSVRQTFSAAPRERSGYPILSNLRNLRLTSGRVRAVTGCFVNDIVTVNHGRRTGRPGGGVLRFGNSVKEKNDVILKPGRFTGGLHFRRVNLGQWAFREAILVIRVVARSGYKLMSPRAAWRHTPESVNLCKPARAAPGWEDLRRPEGRMPAAGGKGGGIANSQFPIGNSQFSSPPWLGIGGSCVVREESGGL